MPLVVVFLELTLALWLLSWGTWDRDLDLCPLLSSL